MATEPARIDPHARHAGGLPAFIASFWRHRELTASLAKREVVGRYRGSLVGIAWSFFNPLLMLAAYTLVFGVVFKARWSTGVSDSKLEFAIVLFVGLLVYGIFSECVNRAPGLVLGRANRRWRTRTVRGR